MLDGQLLNGGGAIILGALAFYVYDCVLMLGRDEVVFARPFRSWSFTFGAGDFTFRHRTLYLLNPLAPFATIVRSHWRTLPPIPNTSCEAEQPYRTMSLRVLCSMQAALIFLILPVFLMAGGIRVLLPLAGEIYLVSLLTVVELWLIRKDLPLPTKVLWQIALDGLLCPPMGINTSRKLQMAISAKGDGTEAVGFARANLAVSDRIAFVDRLNHALDLEAAVIEESEQATLDAFRAASADYLEID